LRLSINFRRIRRENGGLAGEAAARGSGAEPFLYAYCTRQSEPL
jgi:hypothetical protein